MRSVVNTNGVTIPPLRMLKRLADWYGLPLETFTSPSPTPEERLDEIARLAGQREQREWDGGEGRGPSGGDAPGGGPERLTKGDSGDEQQALFG